MRAEARNTDEASRFAQASPVGNKRMQRPEFSLVFQIKNAGLLAVRQSWFAVRFIKPVFRAFFFYFP